MTHLESFAKLAGSFCGNVIQLCESEVDHAQANWTNEFCRRPVGAALRVAG
jgi:hypothetical protein